MTLVTTGAKAEQRTLYGADGRVTSRAITGSNGNGHTHDPLA